jgi:hypothetical protein
MSQTKIVTTGIDLGKNTSISLGSTHEVQLRCISRNREFNFRDHLPMLRPA